MLGGTLASRKLTNQRIGARIKAMILNQMTALHKKYLQLPPDFGKHDVFLTAVKSGVVSIIRS